MEGLCHWCPNTVCAPFLPSGLVQCFWIMILHEKCRKTVYHTSQFINFEPKLYSGLVWVFMYGIAPWSLQPAFINSSNFMPILPPSLSLAPMKIFCPQYVNLTFWQKVPGESNRLASNLIRSHQYCWALKDIDFVLDLFKHIDPLHVEWNPNGASVLSSQ